MKNRFESKVLKTESCWLWQGKIFKKKGYGHFWVNGSYRYAHRISFEIFKGPIPYGKHVLHSCDVRHCVNPDHLRIGTNQDNVKDREDRGRGWKHRQLKLNLRK